MCVRTFPYPGERWELPDEAPRTTWNQRPIFFDEFEKIKKC